MGFSMSDHTNEVKSSIEGDIFDSKVLTAGRDIHCGDATTGDIDKSTTIINIFLGDSSKNTPKEQAYLRDLDLSGIPSGSILKAYQDSLPPDADVWDLPSLNADMSDLAGNNIEVILKKLDGFRQLSQFFERLSQDQNLPVEIRDKIANKLSSKKYPEKSKNKSSTDSFSNQLGLLKSYLIATLVPGDNNSDKLLLNAWLISDDCDDSIQYLSKFQSLLDPNEQQTGKLCSLTQIPTELDKFITKALRYLRGKVYDLTIEIFLPHDLMCMEIDRWKITDPISEEITLGIRYPIRLRSLERLDFRYLDSYLSQWYKYWNLVRDILQHEPTQELFEHLQEIESFKWELLRNKLNGKIGLKVTCAHSKSLRKNLFKAILQATTPIAIWIRTDIANLDQVTAIDKILHFKPLCHLCESVRLTREQADVQTEEHLGYHLALLWENPYRLPPDIMHELNSPGQ
jgi:hypothetical protein